MLSRSAGSPLSPIFQTPSPVPPQDHQSPFHHEPPVTTPGDVFVPLQGNAEPLPPHDPAAALPLIAGLSTFFQSSEAFASTAIPEKILTGFTNLPASWQLWLGGLLFLYAPTGIRACVQACKTGGRIATSLWNKTKSFFGFKNPPIPADPKNEAPDAPQETDSFFRNMDNWIGLQERRFSAFRNTAGWGTLGVMFCSGLLGNPFGAAAAAVIGGLSLYSTCSKHKALNHLIDREIEQGVTLTSRSFQEHYSRAQNPSAPGIPTSFSEKEIIPINAQGMPELPDYREGVTPSEGYLLNLAGLRIYLNATFTGVRRSFYELGFWNTVKAMASVTFLKKIAPISPEMRLALDRIFARFTEWYMRIHGVKFSIDFSRLDAQVPKDSLILHSLVPHSSIYTDFGSWLAAIGQRSHTGRVRFAPDIKNFHNHPFPRFLQLAYLLDRAGFPYIERNGTANNNLINRFIELYTNQVEPALFPQGTRVSIAYDDQGKQTRAGFYGAADLTYPTRFCKMGVAQVAIDVANRLQKPVYVAIEVIEGSEFIMPKVAKNPPFIQKNRSGGEITVKVVDIVRVDPTNRPDEGSQEPHKKSEKTAAEKARTYALLQDIMNRTRQAYGIEKILKDQVTAWFGEDLGATFSRLVTPTDHPEHVERKMVMNEAWLILVDRLRSVHPNYRWSHETASLRDSLKNELKNLLLEVDLLENTKRVLKEKRLPGTFEDYEKAQTLSENLSKTQWEKIHTRILSLLDQVNWIIKETEHRNPLNERKKKLSQNAFQKSLKKTQEKRAEKGLMDSLSLLRT